MKRLSLTLAAVAVVALYVVLSPLIVLASALFGRFDVEGVFITDQK